jgi:glyoxylase-like metal-dependent hydrolase (beta-lactamase superfamily II)
MPGRLYLSSKITQEYSLLALKFLRRLFRRRPVWDAAVNTTEHGSGTFLVQGPASNWVIVREGADFILIDSGYPADAGLVLASIRNLGLEPASAKALLVTHGHADHTGAAKHFSTTFGTPVYCAAAEIPQLTGQVKHQVTFPKVLPRIHQHGILAWMLHAIGAGGLKTNDIQAAQAFDAEALKALPGSPVAVPTPGHTPGHTSFYLPGTKVLVTGDCLVTGHPISCHDGPQLLDPMYHHRPDEVLMSLDALAGFNASTILPGHGAAVHGAMADIIAAVKK